MIQVDASLAYGVGALYALANDAEIPWWRQRSLRRAAAVLLIAYLPTTLFFSLRHPSWQTMHLTSGPLPPAWMAAMSVGLLLSAWLGFRFGSALAGYPVLKALNVAAPFVLSLLVTVVGWDGSGYRRFLAPTASALEAPPDPARLFAQGVGWPLLASGTIIVSWVAIDLALLIRAAPAPRESRT